MIMPINLKHLTQISLTAGALIVSGCAANTLPVAQDQGAGAEQAEVEPAAPATAKGPVKGPGQQDVGPIAAPPTEGLDGPPVDDISDL
jgi:hypothetical protein